TLIVEKISDNWLINSVSVGRYETDDALVYRDVQYGFSFSLPVSWKGYKIVTDVWQGIVLGDEEDDEVIETGPIKLIRHPQWSSENPRQDIPIMIFTHTQWDALQNGEFSVGAAPIGPKELARNDSCVFALPARYNFAFPEGYEEVEDILNGSPLQVDS
ncbi:MAG TPA: hypothetical protein VFD15_01440, partial [Clostridia bacterium]|nr:hypothetical protein [Clostridia bacterium]